MTTFQTFFASLKNPVNWLTTVGAVTYSIDINKKKASLLIFLYYIKKFNINGG